MGDNMLFTLIKKNIFIRLSKTMIILLSIAVGASIIFSFASIYFDINTKMTKELRAFGSNFFIAEANPANQEGMKLKDYEKALSLIDSKSLAGATAMKYGMVRLDLGNAVLVGLNLTQARKINPFWEIEGSWINVDFDEKNCMIGKNLAKTMELEIGSKVNIINATTGFKKKLIVKGIIESGDAADNQMFVNLSLADKVLGNSGIVNYAMLSLVNSTDAILNTAIKINEEIPTLNAKPIRKVSHSEGIILNKIKGLMAIIAIMILLITTLCVNTTLIASITERSKEIGLQKALGASNKKIIQQFLIENVCISIIGIALGMILGYILAQLMGKAVFDSAIDLRVQVFPITFIISMIASLLATWLPIKKALDIIPAQVLRGE